MSHHGPKHLSEADKSILGEKAWPAFRNLFVVGLISLIVALVYSLVFAEHGAARFAFAYLVGYAFALAITLGCLFFVLVTTLFRAGWCVAFRRVPECFAANMPTLAVLFIPILIFVFIGRSGEDALYPWANDEIHHVYDGADGHAKVDLSNPLIALAAAPGEGEAHGASEHTPYRPIAPDETPKPAPEAAHDDHAEAGHDDHAMAEGDAHGEDAHGDHEEHGEHGDDHAEHGEHAGGHHGATWTHTGDTWPDHDHAVPYFVDKKGPYYTRSFFAFRWVLYFLIWSGVAAMYWRNSVKQDATGDLKYTYKREWWAPMSMVAFGVTITLAAFDLLMSLDPVWYSTMFGVYFFAGSTTTALCTMILTLMTGQKFGYFSAVTKEHFHDLGKLLFAFVFFWGYVGFSQYMLIWYASLPETTYWWEIRGITTVHDAPTYGGPWAYVGWLMLFGHLLIPFAVLLSKHVKRNRLALMCVAIWMLFICYVDLFWVAIPALVSPGFVVPVPETLCAIGCVAITVAFALRLAAKNSLTAYKDPRMHESLALDTTAWAPLYPPPASLTKSTSH